MSTFEKNCALESLAYRSETDGIGYCGTKITRLSGLKSTVMRTDSSGFCTTCSADAHALWLGLMMPASSCSSIAFLTLLFR